MRKTIYQTLIDLNEQGQTEKARKLANDFIEKNEIKSVRMKKTFVVTYKEDNTIECVTTDFNKWLHYHNVMRLQDGELEEMPHEFEVKEILFFNY